MERFVDLSLADVGRTVYRYRPVVAAAAAIAVLGLALPSPSRLGSDLAQFSSGPAPATQTPNPVIAEALGEEGTTGVAAAESGSTFAEAPASSPSAFDAPAASFGSTSGSTFDSGANDFSSSAPPSSASSEPTRSSSPPTSEPAATTTTPARPSIVTTLYASRTAGTPLATQGVPEKTLPVGKQLGQDDKLSFIRLSTTPDTLVLKTNPKGERNGANAAVQACLIKTTGWKGGEAVAMSSAPERDCTVSVLGVRSGDGSSWSFDLRPFEGRSGDGFAFSPAPGSPVDFQVAFEATLS